MDKFSNIKPKDNSKSNNKEKLLYDAEYLKIVDFEDYKVLKEKDMVVCIPYLIEENKVILRHEYIPSYKLADGQEYHITIISGGIETGETPEKALFRELEEEAGIIVRPEFKPEALKPLFISKTTCNKFYPYLLVLTEPDYHEVIAKGDGSKLEKMSKCVKVDIKYLKGVNASDLITEYMLDKIKKYINQQ